MWARFVVCLAGFLSSVVGNPSVFYQGDVQPPTPTMRFDHSKHVDAAGRYWLFWTANETHITLETHVKTKGYVGFGLSPNGKMYPSDIMVGWVDGNGQPHLHDYYSVKHGKPILDPHQDWELLYGSEDENGTVLTFARELETCDSHDRAITEDTARVIYSFHDTDPVNATMFEYHGSTRGAKSIVFLSKTLNDIDIPNDTKTFDFVADKYHVPAKPTTYNCKVFRFPELNTKHHMIKYEPVVQPGNEMHVHHIVIYACNLSTNLTRFLNLNYECHENNPVPESICTNVIVAWAVGGETFYYPPNAGVSLGTDQDSKFYLLEVHYDNPYSRADIIDSSGIRVSYTPTLRFYDVGILTVEVEVSNKMVIPPNEKQFISQGYCPAKVLSHGIPPGGVKVFAVLQHSHLLGRAIKTRHIRNGKEQKPLAEDDNYDFNYQFARVLQQERTIIPGDSFEVDCVYDSTGKDKPTYGGYSTREEMCVSFIVYYPKMDLDYCITTPLYNAYINYDYQNISEFSAIIENMNWTDPNEHYRFHDALHVSPQALVGFGQNMKPPYVQFIEKEPVISSPYQKPPTKCSSK